MSLKTYCTIPYGEPIALDISDEACTRFGLTHDQLMQTPLGTAKVAGVGLCNCGCGNPNPHLWFSILKFDNEVCYANNCYNPKDFARQGIVPL